MKEYKQPELAKQPRTELKINYKHTSNPSQVLSQPLLEPKYQSLTLALQDLGSGGGS